jgi:hypothetical protein
MSVLTVYVTVFFVQYLTKTSNDAPCGQLFDSGSRTTHHEHEVALRAISPCFLRAYGLFYVRRFCAKVREKTLFSGRYTEILRRIYELLGALFSTHFAPPLSAHFGHAGELQRAANGGVRSSYHMVCSRRALS